MYSTDKCVLSHVFVWKIYALLRCTRKNHKIQATLVLLQKLCFIYTLTFRMQLFIQNVIKVQLQKLVLLRYTYLRCPDQSRVFTNLATICYERKIVQNWWNISRKLDFKKKKIPGNLRKTPILSQTEIEKLEKKKGMSKPKKSFKTIFLCHTHLYCSF